MSNASIWKYLEAICHLTHCVFTLGPVESGDLKEIHKDASGMCLKRQFTQ